jgi:hypothetical protein
MPFSALYDSSTITSRCEHAAVSGGSREQRETRSPPVYPGRTNASVKSGKIFPRFSETCYGSSFAHFLRAPDNKRGNFNCLRYDAIALPSRHNELRKRRIGKELHTPAATDPCRIAFNDRRYLRIPRKHDVTRLVYERVAGRIVISV